MPKPSQECPVSFKAPNQDLKDIDVLCTFKIKIESKTDIHIYTNDLWPYTNHDQDAKPLSGTSIVLESPKWGLEGHGWSLHLQKNNYLDFGIWQDSMLFWAKLIWVNIKLKSWAFLSWLFWPKLIWIKIKFDNWASLSWFFWAKLIWVKTELNWASLSRSQLSWACLSH